jgi:hypothetical protein
MIYGKGPEKKYKTRRCTPNCSIGKRLNFKKRKAAKALQALVTKMKESRKVTNLMSLICGVFKSVLIIAICG